ncbi:MAG TPA: biopolymer transporter ExbD [Planctomycetota bacterium]|nr:biopolymer transporter ExbD [Planctomycetota bacterium]HRR78667.1 biopolymer transporter ExbD [Planctomycetota bacterium]HRT96980.1 biopolymer transporter ExbD [Planctomycetota bacterium]
MSTLLRQPERRVKLTEMSFTPLIDCVFLLLLFFMVGTRFREIDRELETRLPPTGPRIAGRFDELAIAVRNIGTAEAPRPQVAIDHQVMPDWRAVRVRLRDLAAVPGGRDFPVLMEPADDAQHGWVMNVLDCLREFGYRRVSFKR